MKVTVLQTYIDKNTGAAYKRGDVVEYADDRAKELAEKGFVKPEKAVAVAKVEKKVAATKKTTATKKK